MRNYGVVLAVLVGLLGISACSVQNKKSSNQNRYSKVETSEWRLHIEQIEAKLVDIPLPLKTLLEPQKVSFSDRDATAVMLNYHVRLSVDEVSLFYQQEMERAGWQEVMLFAGPESLLVFERSARSCIITVRSAKQLTELTIVVGAKIAY